jgi:hypothetical protein
MPSQRADEIQDNFAFCHDELLINKILKSFREREREGGDREGLADEVGVIKNTQHKSRRRFFVY